MKTVIIKNPVIDSLFDKQKRHLRLSHEGITNEIASFLKLKRKGTP